MFSLSQKRLGGRGSNIFENVSILCLIRVVIKSKSADVSDYLFVCLLFKDIPNSMGDVLKNIDIRIV